MSTAAEIHRKFFPDARPVVSAPPALWRSKPPPMPRRVVRRLIETRDIAPVVPPAWTRINRIMTVVAIMFNTTRVELAGRVKKRILVAARMYAAVRLSRELGLSTSHIGRILGRDHSTISNLLSRADGFPLVTINGQSKRRNGRPAGRPRRKSNVRSVQTGD